MELSITIIVLILLCVFIWAFTEIKRLKHKIIAVFLVGLLVFFFFSIKFVFDSNPVDIKTIPGIIKATKLYFSWLGSIFLNIKEITLHTINLEWNKNNQTFRND
jgi:hypothetical protein